MSHALAEEVLLDDTWLCLTGEPATGAATVNGGYESFRCQGPRRHHAQEPVGGMRHPNADVHIRDGAC